MRELKKSLLLDALNWVKEDPAGARQEFAESAADVISHLTRIAEKVRGG